MSNSKYHDVTFRIFDGPDNRNRLIKANKKVFLSSFFCYLEVDSFQNATFYDSFSFSMQLGPVKKYYIKNKKRMFITKYMCKTQSLVYCILIFQQFQEALMCLLCTWGTLVLTMISADLEVFLFSTQLFMKEQCVTIIQKSKH